MGTTLTGTTPQDTYDSLIKVTDNGPIGTSLKTLTDGLGNDSALALSSRGVKVNTSATLITDAASLCHFSNNFLYVRGGSAGLSIGDDAFSNSITLADNADIAFEAGSAERMRITAAGNVGIGTSAPSGKLSVGGTQGSTIGSNVALLVANTGAAATVGNRIQIGLHYNPDGSTISTAMGSVITNGAGFTKSDIFFATRDVTTDTAPTERVRILSSGGITFNGDTAAANALDDYEEGTWTIGVSFGGASAGVTTSANTGTYTKIGRQVTVNGYLILTSKGSSTGSARITGLPFTIANTNGNYSPASLYFSNVSFTNQFQGYGVINSTIVALEETTILGIGSAITNADFADDSNIMISLTYFV
jgi:hypothetical protein